MNWKTYEQYISDFYRDLTYLGSVSLKKNKINIKVSTVSENVEYNEVFWTEFRATISQDDKEIAQIDFKGCNKEQPHTFEGYMVPDTDKMAVLISNVGDCFEGGYIYEKLFLIDKVKYYDTTIIRSYKQASATIKK